MGERDKKELQPPIQLAAQVVNLTHRTGVWSNYAYSYFGIEQHECGHDWQDYIIEATIVLPDDPQNKNHRLKRLVLYTQSSTRYGPEGVEEDYLQKVQALTPGNTVLLTIDTEALGNDRPTFMGENDEYYYEEDPRGGRGYSDDPELVRLREEIRQIARDGFTPQSVAVNLKFVRVQVL